MDSVKFTTHLRPEENGESSETTHEHYCKQTAPACDTQSLVPRIVEREVNRVLTKQEDTPTVLPLVTEQPRKIDSTYFDVRLFMTPVVVLYCFARAKIPAIPVYTVSFVLLPTTRNTPIPESKSGTMAARVMMRRCKFLRPLLQFCGSRGESVGCGQSTFVPSAVSFSLAAIASPSSIWASL